jgi:formylglycine-generating enzyme required for sulfatase activity
MGDNVYAEEKLVRNVQVKGFWMDRTEVTNQEFAAFVKATGYVTVAERPIDPKLHAGLPEVMRQAGAVVFKMPSQLTRGDDPSQWWQYVPGANWQHPAGPSSTIDKHGHFPVVHITYEDALAYAKWKGRSLPTEAQWEWAARAGASALPHQHDQPASANTWQGIFPMANSAEDGFAGLAPVGCYGANAWGLFDMIGNVWELTSDVFVADRTAPAIGQGQGLDPDAAQKPPDFKAGKVQARVIKGGSFLCAPNYCMRYRAGSRQAQEEDLAVSHLGFRTVLQP